MEKKESYWSEQAVPGSFSEKERERESAAAAAWSHEFCLEPVNSIY